MLSCDKALSGTVGREPTFDVAPRLGLLECQKICTGLWRGEMVRPCFLARMDASYELRYTDLKSYELIACLVASNQLNLS